MACTPSLLGLPLELRHQIYFYLLWHHQTAPAYPASSSDGLVQVSHDIHLPAGYQTKSCSIPLVNKQLHDESVEYFSKLRLQPPLEAKLDLMSKATISGQSGLHYRSQSIVTTLSTSR